MKAALAILHVLECLKVGAAIIDDADQVISHNETYASSLEALGLSSSDTIPRLQAVTHDAVKCYLRNGEDWLHVLRSDTGHPLVLHCLGETQDGAQSNLKVLIVLALDRYPTPKRSTLQRLFGLSPAEANVGKLLSSGLSVSEIAERTRTTKHTVRAHLKHIFQKTNTSTQGSLAHILRRCSLLPSLAAAQEHLA